MAESLSNPFRLSEIETRSGTKLSMPAVGLGTAPLGNMFQAWSEDEAQAALSIALDRGVSYFDTAPLYGLGLSERRLGVALRGRDRSKLIVSTKAGRLLRRCPADKNNPQAQWINVPSREILFDYSYDGFMRSYEFSLERLGIDRVEILYCHDLDLFTHANEAEREACVRTFLGASGGYRALEELRAAGDVDAIGLGVNEWQICDRIAQETEVDLFLLAGRFTLLEQEPLSSFLPRCIERKMHVVIGGPFNSGILATGPINGATFNYAAAPAETLEKTKRIEAVCKSHGVPLAVAALQFPFLHPAVVSVIPGGATEAQISRNLDGFAQPIPNDLWRELQSLGLLDEALALGE